MTLQLVRPDTSIVSRFGHVAVLMGGESAEREVSLSSGRAVHQALLDAGVDAVAVDLQGHVFHQITELQIDRVFNVLHGRGGEDGRVRAVLDFLGIPCTGSNACASALTMNKVLTKKVMRHSGIATPDYFELHDEAACERLLEEFDLPVFVKPVLEGSSIGTAPVFESSQLFPAWKAAHEFGAVMAERFVDGEEFTAGFIGEQILPLIKLETPNAFYDYEAKYIADDTVYTCPSGLDDASVSEINALVTATIRATGVSGWGRVDLMMDSWGKPWIIEVNTVPGMTDHSLIPLAARVAGLDMAELVVSILAATLPQEERHVQVA